MRNRLFGLLWMVMCSLALAADHKQPTPEQIEKMNADIQKFMQDPALKQQMDEAMKRARQAQASAPPPPPAQSVGSDGQRKKDSTRIAQIARTPQTSTEMEGHLRAVTAAVEQRLKPAPRAAAEKLYAKLKAAGIRNAVASAASGVWMSGLAEMGLYLMGRAALDNPDNTEHLNNYAAFLVMSGAEPQAVPILQKLKAQYPENTTVLNNLAQAWYGLGDVDEATQQLDAVLRRLPAHSQANYTKAEILEAKGDKVGAAAAIALSAQDGYSDAKARMAKRLGKVLAADIGNKPPRQAVDAMGLQKLLLPDFCSGIAESAVCDARWKAFHEAVTRKATVIQQRMKVFELEDKALEGKSQSEQLKVMMERNQMSASRPFAVMADRQKRALFERSKNKPIMGSAVWRNETEGLGRNIKLLGLDKNLADIDRRFADQFGEGKANPFDAYCSVLRGTYDKYVKDANGLAAQTAARLITTNNPYFNEDVHLARFMMSDRQFERYKLQQQLSYLSLLSTVTAVPGPLSVGMNCPAAAPMSLSANLQDFYDVKCDHVISFSIPKIGNWEVRCNRMTLNVNASIGPIDLAINRIDDLDNARIVRGRVEIGTSKSTDVGPIEVGATGSTYVEFDGSGVSGVGARGGIDVGGVEVAAGEGQFGWNAGGASDFKGELSGLAMH